MRLGQVIGRVTHSRQDPAYTGGRFLVVQPLSREQFGGGPLLPLAKIPSLVVYDNLGAGTGSIVGFVEGAEATAPFDNPTPVDAITAAIVDAVHANGDSALVDFTERFDGAVISVEQLEVTTAEFLTAGVATSKELRAAIALASRNIESGKLRDWLGSDEIMVNSLHGQGIKRLAPDLQAEAFAENQLVEAVRGPDDEVFCLGVQWHPEWAPKSNEVSVALFRRFGAAARGMTP